MATIAQLRDEIERDTPKWLAEIGLARRANASLEDWLTGKNRLDYSPPSWGEQIYMEEIRRYALCQLQGDKNCKSLGWLGRLAENRLVLSAGPKLAAPKRGGVINFQVSGFYLALLITIGWREEAELAARLSFKLLEPMLGGRHAIFSLPWFMLDLCRDWLGAKVDLRDRDRKGDFLGGWSDLFKHWREPDPALFKKVLDAAADYHLQESNPHVEIGRDDEPGYVDEYYEIEPPEYWLFPVELFAVLRLREWEGLTNPALTHPLFTNTPLGRMPAVEPRVPDRFLDEVEAKFRSIFPQTPTLADLPALRAEQS